MITQSVTATTGKMVFLSDVELVEIITTAVAVALNKAPVKESKEDRKKVYGLNGLAKLLNCSHPTAQRIKDSGKIPYSQAGRKLVFDTDAVLEALKGKEDTK